MAKVIFRNCPLEFQSQMKDVEVEVQTFLKDFNIVEKASFIVFNDLRTNAFYSECHLMAHDLIANSTIDVPLDPENQGDYRANRDAREDHAAYKKMVEDALGKRAFSNIVCEYNTLYGSDKPIKVIGGQHRIMAIDEALKNNIDEYQGSKIYFKLDKAQRLDVQLISNTNIAVSSDLLDRMFETSKGPELRNWCQTCGLLEPSEDFADKKQRGSQISVRGARAFIMNYYEGREVDDKSFDKVNTTPILPKTGVVDERWEKLRQKTNMWQDADLLEAGKEFAKLNQAQSNYFKTNAKENAEYSEKAIAYSILSAWAYIAGLLYKNKVRLKKHFELAEVTNTDPLASKVLAKAKHRTDPDNYRGIGTRTDDKERGRMSELFFLQAEKGGGFNKRLVDLAVGKYHAKQSLLDVQELERKMADE
jgi:hypothetical protein